VALKGTEISVALVTVGLGMFTLATVFEYISTFTGARKLAPKILIVPLKLVGTVGGSTLLMRGTARLTTVNAPASRPMLPSGFCTMRS
jgi:hypothetical protein